MDKKNEAILPDNVSIDFNFERMLKNFTKQVEKLGLLGEIKARKFYIKPSEKRREEEKRRRKYAV